MRCVAIITGPETHLDHLGVLSSVLKIPLVVTEERLFRFAKQFYPDLDVTWLDLSTLSIEYLATHYDAIFQTGKFWTAELRPFMELLFRKKMRFVFCPHGNSDKGYSLQNHVEQDISLVYGDHLHDLLKQTGAAEKIRHIVRTGNYRYRYYLRHRTFYDNLASEMVFNRFQPKKPLILYAPTWQDKENPTSFFSATDALIEQLSPSFHILIKLHPFLIEDYPAQVYSMINRYENHDSALLLVDFPPIYPLLARCNLYLGDYSSIGYDFLAFDRPLYFLNPKKSPNASPLHSCGLEISEKVEGGLNQFLTDTLEMNMKEFATQRKKIYSHAFGEELEPGRIRDAIFKTFLDR
jgi:teichoic acid glycerol-phosphate primase